MHPLLQFVMHLIVHGHRMMDAVAFAYGCSIRKAGDPITPLSSVFDVPTVPKVQEADASQFARCIWM